MNKNNKDMVKVLVISYASSGKHYETCLLEDAPENLYSMLIGAEDENGNYNEPNYVASLFEVPVAVWEQFQEEGCLYRDSHYFIEHKCKELCLGDYV